MRYAIQLAILFCCIHIVSADSIPGQAALKAGDYNKARAEVAAASTTDRSPILTLMLARISLAENKLDEAEALIDSVLEVAPKNALAHSLRGQVYGLKASRASLFRAGKHSKKSLAALETALDLDPELEEALQGLIQYRLSAPALFGGSIDKALQNVKKLQQINPVSGGLELANIYAKQEDGARQVSVLEQLTRSHPHDPRAPLALGFIEQGERNWDLAGSWFNAAMNAACGQPEHNYSAQAARYQIGRTVVLSKTDSETKLNHGIKALSDYLKGSRFADLPDFEWAHYRRGLLYAQFDSMEKEAQLDFALAAKTDNRNLMRALKSVSLRSVL